MINFDDIAGENIKELSPNWPQIPDHPYIKSIIGGRELGKKSIGFFLFEFFYI